VDAYPGATFRGVVDEVRLNAASVNNVVTYTTIIKVKNPDFRLIPGMTARFTLETGRANNVLRLPAMALRFRPNVDALIKFPDTVLPAAGAARVLADTSVGTVWRVDGRRLVRVPVTLGLTDGKWVQVTGGGLRDGDEVISSITQLQSPGRPGAASGNPFAPRPMFRRGRGRF
jgi:HlyD family secretion protein